MFSRTSNGGRSILTDFKVGDLVKTSEKYSNHFKRTIKGKIINILGKGSNKFEIVYLLYDIRKCSIVENALIGSEHDAHAHYTLDIKDESKSDYMYIKTINTFWLQKLTLKELDEMLVEEL
jgi:hypothetical protein